MIKEKYKQLFLYHQIRGIRTITHICTLAVIEQSHR